MLDNDDAIFTHADPGTEEAVSRPSDQSVEDRLLCLAVIQAAMESAELDIEPVVTGQHAQYVHINLIGPDASRFAGSQIDALQEVVNTILSRQQDAHVRVVLDAGGYRELRAQKLRQLATDLAREVIETGQEAVLDPLPASERRVIHLTLKDIPGVATYSEGEGSERHIIITPAKEA